MVVTDSRFIGHHAMVGCDQVTGTHDAVTHLLDLGHRTVHHISGPETSAPALMRADGWRDTLLAAGRSVPAAFEGEWSNLLDLLMRQIREKNRLSDVRVIVPAPLIVRASTAPPPGV